MLQSPDPQGTFLEIARQLLRYEFQFGRYATQPDSTPVVLSRCELKKYGRGKRLVKTAACSPKLVRTYKHAQAKTIFHDLLDLAATVTVGTEEVLVTLDKRAHNPIHRPSRLTVEPSPVPWFGGRQFQVSLDPSP